MEGMEGTDETIRRGGALGGGRALVVKVAKPSQDLRFDLPSVGLATVETMAASDCTALVLEAGRTLTFDREKTIALADQKGIAILALEEDAVEPNRVGVLGVGYLGRFHARKYAANPKAELVGVVDSTLDGPGRWD